MGGEPRRATEIRVSGDAARRFSVALDRPPRFLRVENSRADIGTGADDGESRFVPTGMLCRNPGGVESGHDMESADPRQHHFHRKEVPSAGWRADAINPASV